MPESVSAHGIPDKFPAGLRVLVADDNRFSLLILEKMLKQFNYEVTICNGANVALSLLRENKNGYDILVTEVHMPDMDGFKLLEQVGLETDLPVIMMSEDDSNAIVMKSITHGACDYLIKPVCVEALRNIWQHVVRRRKNEWKDFESLTSAVDEAQLQVDYKSSAKKHRVVWSIELHRQFVAAVNQLGIDEALPEKILELMNVPNLTREHVAKHLQCYRTYLRRFSMSQGSIDTPFKVIPDAGYNLKPPSCG